MGTRGRKSCNIESQSRLPDLKPLTCPKCARKLNDVNFADGYFTCIKCRYNFYDVLSPWADLRTSAESMENNPQVMYLVADFREKIKDISQGKKVYQTDNPEEPCEFWE